MVTDPYRVLGISRDASKEEIKKAYRKKAKEYHPDLHPNDSKAAEKMNEINEAYDMLSNPEKYQKRESQGTGTSHSQGGYYQRTSYGGSTNQGYGGQGSFWGFDFEDMFGFGARTQPLHKPVKESNDTEEIRQAVDYICMERYELANRILNQVISSRRNARWHYLNALTNHGLGNQIKALEEIRKAVQMEPDNQLYRQTYSSMNRTGNEYQSAGEEFRKAAEGMERYCMSFCAMHFFCTFCRCY